VAKILKTKKDKQQFTRWLKALRSEKYSQCRGRLQGPDGFCCLGVACDVLIPDKEKHMSGDFLSGYFPNHQAAPQWLNHVNCDFSEKTKIEGKSQNLSEMNDNQSMPFALIADCLEIVYENELNEFK